ncbi:MAG: DUF433 domain-containing protein [Chloroflexia bacterium]
MNAALLYSFQADWLATSSLTKYGGEMALTLLAVAPPLRLDDHQVARVGKTRVTLDSVIADFKAGSSAEAIEEHYPAVSLAEVYAVLAYYLRNQDEVEGYLRESRRRPRLPRAMMRRRGFRLPGCVSASRGAMRSGSGCAAISCR